MGIELGSQISREELAKRPLGLDVPWNQSRIYTYLNGGILGVAFVANAAIHV